ncbi:Zinc carboxypeptidase [Arthrobacter crystallopoietes BAB-32]|uniref:Zinc carboxypeptidase n=1 Tax=Arthrobacter crystallopoietes BAB-32 TaxID=1246476 RepID=N1V1F0_9MICC|nr:M14 family zinc carboxypeptidase [Arthrobacter crystallopoietes]EMY33892.1 Zinc carboxypeptidase [Arthrobacter crystallopoietes BAB-32]
MSQKSRSLFGALGAATMLCTMVSALPASATPAESNTPGQGTCKTWEDPQFSGWTTYEELGPRLEAIESNSKGRVEVDVVGQSAQGRDLYTARIGTGDRVLLVQSAIHGNERTGTEALLHILKKLGSSNDPATLRALEGVTLVAMPMVNPDGGELNRRTNVMSWEKTESLHPQLEGSTPAWYHRTSNGGINLPGFDLNRDFNADLDYVPQAADLPGVQEDAGFFLAPESQTIRDVYVDLREEFGAVDAVVDLHHMGPCDVQTGGEQDGKHISVALDYPPLGVNDGAAYQQDWPLLDQDKSRRYALAVADGIKDSYGSQSPLAAVGRYFHPEEREYAGQGRSAFALNGSATVLFEVRGQSDDFGQKMKGMLVETVETGLESLIDSMATGEVDTLDGDDFFDYPDYGWDKTSD